VVLVLEPIFEADLEPEQYAYRANRSALDAVDHVRRLLDTGHTEVIDADLSGYFDGIPHAELLRSVSRRVSDRHLLALIARWLETPVEEIDERGRPHRTTRARDEKRGTPQGAPISPLLSNLYMRRFVLGWKMLGHEKRLGARIVNYADDFVICCRSNADEAMAAMRVMMSKLRLAVNETKTRLRRLPEETFDFLGYTFGRLYSPRTGGAYLGVHPSSKKVQRLCREISELTGRQWCWLPAEAMVARLNRKLVGWANYFCLGASRAYRAVDSHTCDRLRHWLAAKHKEQGWRRSRFPEDLLYRELGLVQLQRRRHRFS
jgi:group II intron reverse transcriptase/maturase